MVVAAVVGAVATVGGSIASSSAQKSAANKASAAQTASNQAAMEQQQAQYNQTRSDLMPWQTAGTTALGQQGDLLGLNGGAAQQSAISAQQNSPLYESLFRNGQNTMLANASATGGLRGGNTQGALANFGKDTLAQVIESQLNRLGGVSEQGQNAAAQTGQFGAQAANQTSALLNNTGAAQANAAYAVGGANANMINSITGSAVGLANNSSVQNWVGKLF